MRSVTRNSLAAATWVALLSFALNLSAAELPGPNQPFQPAKDEFDQVGQAVVRLLQTRDATRFARDLTPSVADYRAIISTNRLAGDQDPTQGMRMTQAFEQHKVEASAKALLARLDALHVVLTNSDLRATPMMPQSFGNMHWANLQDKGQTIPWTEAVEFALKSDTPPANATNGQFSLEVQGLLKFPAGWRSSQGVQWSAFPAGIAGSDTVRDMALLKKVNHNQGFTEQNDPALRKLGAGLVQFLRERDTNVFAKDVLVTPDLLWAQIKKSRMPEPPRQAFDEHMATQTAEQLQNAELVLHQMEQSGIDLKDAQVDLLQAGVQRSQSQGEPGSMDGVMGIQFRLNLEVKTSRKAASGASLAGQYTLAARQLMRFGDQWRLMDGLRWYQLPEGVLDAKSASDLEFENYVAEHGTLPVGKPAPDIEFRRLSDGQPQKLSSLRGKVVVLDFWATWCGPCQGPMAELQKLPAAHPAWQDKVAIVPLSIDDTIEAVRAHVDKRGWTNTFNVWAGDGGWHAAPPQTFRVTGVPTTYILDPKGRIVRAGHPASMDIPGEVDALLKRADD